MHSNATRLAIFFIGWVMVALLLWKVPGIRGVVNGFLRPAVEILGGGVQEEGMNDELSKGDVELLRLRDAERKTAALEAMLDLDPSTQWDTIAARVIGRDPVIWDLSFTIGKGTADGVRKGAAVLAGGMVVGRVQSLSRRVAVVETILAPGCKVGAKLQESGGVGIVNGRAGGKTVCLVDFLDRDRDYRVGEQVITSGLSEVIPGGLPLGRVVPWNKQSTVNIVNSSYAQLRMRAATVREDFRYVWVVSLRRGNVHTLAVDDRQ